MNNSRELITKKEPKILPIEDECLLTQSNEKESEYIKSLCPKEYAAYLIAKSHLGMSFTLSKSAGFITRMNQ
jgi:hypothetical protein